MPHPVTEATTDTPTHIPMHDQGARKSSAPRIGKAHRISILDVSPPPRPPSSPYSARTSTPPRQHIVTAVQSQNGTETSTRKAGTHQPRELEAVVYFLRVAPQSSSRVLPRDPTRFLTRLKEAKGASRSREGCRRSEGAPRVASVPVQSTEAQLCIVKNETAVELCRRHPQFVVASRHARSASYTDKAVYGEDAPRRSSMRHVSSYRGAVPGPACGGKLSSSSPLRGVGGIGATVLRSATAATDIGVAASVHGEAVAYPVTEQKSWATEAAAMGTEASPLTRKAEEEHREEKDTPTKVVRAPSAAVDVSVLYSKQSERASTSEGHTGVAGASNAAVLLRNLQRHLDELKGYLEGAAAPLLFTDEGESGRTLHHAAAGATTVSTVHAAPLCETGMNWLEASVNANSGTRAGFPKRSPSALSTDVTSREVNRESRDPQGESNVDVKVSARPVPASSSPALLPPGSSEVYAAHLQQYLEHTFLVSHEGLPGSSNRANSTAFPTASSILAASSASTSGVHRGAPDPLHFPPPFPAHAHPREHPLLSDDAASDAVTVRSVSVASTPVQHVSNNKRQYRRHHSDESVATCGQLRQDTRHKSWLVALESQRRHVFVEGDGGRPVTALAKQLNLKGAREETLDVDARGVQQHDTGSQPITLDTYMWHHPGSSAASLLPLSSQPEGFRVVTPQTPVHAAGVSRCGEEKERSVLRVSPPAENDDAFSPATSSSATTSLQSPHKAHDDGQAKNGVAAATENTGVSTSAMNAASPPPHSSTPRGEATERRSLPCPPPRTDHASSIRPRQAARDGFTSARLRNVTREPTSAPAPVTETAKRREENAVGANTDAKGQGGQQPSSPHDMTNIDLSSVEGGTSDVEVTHDATLPWFPPNEPADPDGGGTRDADETKGAAAHPIAHAAVLAENATVDDTKYTPMCHAGEAGVERGTRAEEVDLESVEEMWRQVMVQREQGGPRPCTSIPRQRQKKCAATTTAAITHADRQHPSLTPHTFTVSHAHWYAPADGAASESHEAQPSPPTSSLPAAADKVVTVLLPTATTADAADGSSQIFVPAVSQGEERSRAKPQLPLTCVSGTFDASLSTPTRPSAERLSSSKHSPLAKCELPGAAVTAATTSPSQINSNAFKALLTDAMRNTRVEENSKAEDSPSRRAQTTTPHATATPTPPRMQLAMVLAPPSRRASVTIQRSCNGSQRNAGSVYSFLHVLPRPTAPSPSASPLRQAVKTGEETAGKGIEHGRDEEDTEGDDFDGQGTLKVFLTPVTVDGKDGESYFVTPRSGEGEEGEKVFRSTVSAPLTAALAPKTAAKPTDQTAAALQPTPPASLKVAPAALLAAPLGRASSNTHRETPELHDGTASRATEALLPASAASAAAETSFSAVFPCLAESARHTPESVPPEPISFGTAPENLPGARAHEAHRPSTAPTMITLTATLTTGGQYRVPSNYESRHVASLRAMTAQLHGDEPQTKEDSSFSRRMHRTAQSLPSTANASSTFRQYVNSFSVPARPAPPSPPPQAAGGTSDLLSASQRSTHVSEERRRTKRDSAIGFLPPAAAMVAATNNNTTTTATSCAAVGISAPSRVLHEATMRQQRRRISSLHY